MFEFVIPELHVHKYHLFSTGTKLKAQDYNTRTDAEIAMYEYCNKNGIKVDLCERDKHEYYYQGINKEVEFYINRV